VERNINRTAPNILLLHVFPDRSQLHAADYFLSHWDPYAVLTLEAVAMHNAVTWRSGPGGVEAYWLPSVL